MRFWSAAKSQPLKHGAKLFELIARPELQAADFRDLRNVPEVDAFFNALDALDKDQDETLEAAEVLIKYDGYIARERQLADKMQRLEDLKIRGKFDYNALTQLSTERAKNFLPSIRKPLRRLHASPAFRLPTFRCFSSFWDVESFEPPLLLFLRKDESQTPPQRLSTGCYTFTSTHDAVFADPGSFSMKSAKSTISPAFHVKQTTNINPNISAL